MEPRREQREQQRIPPNPPVSNYDLLKRIEALEAQLRVIVDMFEQGKGALTFLKWIGSSAIALSALYAILANWRIK